jgi:molybdate transport system permease protein
VVLGLDWFPLGLSLRVALASSAVAMLVGVPLAWALARGRIPGKDVVGVALLLPMVLPPTVLGYYLLLLLGRRSPIGQAVEAVFGQSIVFTPVAAAVAAFVASFPFLVRAAQAGFEQVDPEYENVARTLGVPNLRVFLHVSVPLAWRGILAGTALCFARAMGEFGATLMIAGNIPHRTQTASIAIYDAVQAGRLHEATIMSLLLSCVTAVILLVLTRAGRGVRW